MVRCRPLRVLAVSLLVAFAGATVASASARIVRIVALEGDSAPASGGGVFSTFFNPALNDSGRVVFRASTAGGTPLAGGLYESTAGGVINPLVLRGQSAPIPSGEDFSGTSAPLLNETDEVAFRGSLQNGPPSQGIFKTVSGVESLLALHGDAAPVTGGTLDTPMTPTALDQQGNVLFWADVEAGFTPEGIYLIPSGGSIQLKVVAGQAAPDTGGGTFGGSPTGHFGLSTMNESGEIAFGAYLSGGTSPSGVFRLDSGGGAHLIALEGDPAPGTGGGQYGVLTGGGRMTGSGNVLIRAPVTGGSAVEGIFLAEPDGTQSALLVTGDVAPGTEGYTYSDFVHLAASELGDFVVDAFVTDPVTQTDFRGIFVYYANGSSALVALEGEPAQPTVGGVYGSVFHPSLNPKGDVVFVGNVTGGTAAQAVFVSELVPAHVPTLPVRGLVILTALLAVTAARKLDRTHRGDGAQQRA